jgi:hypothetical protein
MKGFVLNANGKGGEMAFNSEGMRVYEAGEIHRVIDNYGEPRLFEEFFILHFREVSFWDANEKQRRRKREGK